MTDITTKLRSGNYGWLSQDLNAEAADEIDRLRAELAGYVEANRYMKGELEDAIEDARKYAEAKGEIASLRTALDRLLCATEGHDVCPYAKAEARYVLTPEGK